MAQIKWDEVGGHVVCIGEVKKCIQFLVKSRREETTEKT
jgi:hypothetical protein